MKKQYINLLEERQELSYWWLIAIIFIWNIVTVSTGLIIFFPAEIAFIVALRTGKMTPIFFLLLGIPIVTFLLLPITLMVFASWKIAWLPFLIFVTVSISSIASALVGRIIYNKKNNLSGYDKFSRILSIITPIILSMLFIGLYLYSPASCETSRCYTNRAKVSHNPNICAKINKGDFFIKLICHSPGENFQKCEEREIIDVKQSCYRAVLFSSGYDPGNSNQKERCNIIKDLHDRKVCYNWFVR